VRPTRAQEAEAVSESRLSVDCFPMASEDEFFANRRPGAIYFSEKDGKLFVWVAVPSPCETGIAVGRLPVNQPNGWSFDGNRERPTLTPSIHCVDHWHGFLRAGRLESC